MGMVNSWLENEVLLVKKHKSNIPLEFVNIELAEFACTTAVLWFGDLFLTNNIDLPFAG